MFVNVKIVYIYHLKISILRNPISTFGSKPKYFKKTFLFKYLKKSLKHNLKNGINQFAVVFQIVFETLH